VQHCGGKGDDFEPHTPGWALLPDLVRDPADIVVRKNLNDPFAGTELKARLKEIAPDRLLITGWATDLCVDTTVRSAVENHHSVVVVADGHTLSDRPHLDAISVIRHHHWIWNNLITQRSVRLANASELLA
jgi:nicotinamidase-related amidase